VPVEEEPVILSGAEEALVPGQMIEGEIVHEVFIDGTASDVPVSIVGE
jgi:hypothetical protein